MRVFARCLPKLDQESRAREILKFLLLGEWHLVAEAETRLEKRMKASGCSLGRSGYACVPSLLFRKMQGEIQCEVG